MTFVYKVEMMSTGMHIVVLRVGKTFSTTPDRLAKVPHARTAELEVN
jgi:hypothetical protein